MILCYREDMHEDVWINFKTLNLDSEAGDCFLVGETQPVFCPYWCLDQLFLVQPKLGELITALMNWITENMLRSLKV